MPILQAIYLAVSTPMGSLGLSSLTMDIAIAFVQDVSKIYVGSSKVTKAYVGSTEVDRIYVGSTRVF